MSDILNKIIESKRVEVAIALQKILGTNYRRSASGTARQKFCRCHPCQTGG